MSFKVEFKNIKKKYDENVVLDGFTFEVEKGNFIVIVGAPGSGKSVILRLLLGLEQCDSGSIYLRGQNACEIGPGERNIGYVPQSFALFPHMTVFKNIGYPLKLKGESKEIIEKKVFEVARKLGIKEYLNKKPDQLSGGQKQRVAIARGLVKESDIYVLDDPLVGLDFKLREKLQDDLKQIQQDLKATFIYSTSDCLEALSLADKVVIFSNKKAIEQNAPEKMYFSPEHLNSARILGFPKVNEFEGRFLIDRNTLNFKSKYFDLKLNYSENDMSDIYDINEKEAIACVRPENIKIDDNHKYGDVLGKANLLLKEDLGGEVIINMDWEGQEFRSVVSHDKNQLIKSEIVSFSINPEDIYFFMSPNGCFIAKGEKND